MSEVSDVGKVFEVSLRWIDGLGRVHRGLDSRF